MTRDEVLAMKPGRELDVLVTERVMGWDVHSKFIGKFNLDYDLECSYVIDEPPDDCPEELKAVTGQIIIRRVPNFSTDISAAWEVVGKMSEQWPQYQLAKIEDGWSVMWGFDGYGWPDVTAATAPEAICKAALLAVMDGEDEHERD